MSAPFIILAGATGDVGMRIARALKRDGTATRALVRRTADATRLATLRQIGVEVVPVDMDDPAALRDSCVGGTCVVSALSGLEPVIVEAQSKLLEAAIAAGVPRFIPSDYSIDYTKLTDGSNRNLDLRRKFKARLDAAPIRATSIFNGAFADMLLGQMPIILFKQHRVLYWGDPDQKMEFTTKDNTAAFTARAAADDTTPRDLHIAGGLASPRDLVRITTEATGEEFKLFRVGGLGLLKAMIKVARVVAPQPDQLYSPWQGMQYLHNMMSGAAYVGAPDNDRYSGLHWTPLGEVIQQG